MKDLTGHRYLKSQQCWTVNDMDLCVRVISNLLHNGETRNIILIEAKVELNIE